MTISKERIKEIMSPQFTPTDKRVIEFKTYNSAKQFCKELIKNTWETDSCKIVQELVGGWTEKCDKNGNDDLEADMIRYVDEKPIKVEFFYSSYEENDKKVLSKLLNKYKKDIL